MTKRYTFLSAAAIMAAMSLAPVAPIQTGQAHAAFADLGQSGSYQTAVQALVQQKVLAGYSDRAFKPNQAAARAEVAKMIVLALGVETTQTAVPLRDVAQQDWYYSYAQAAVQAGLLAGRNGSFQPNAHITAGELADAVAKAAQLTPADVQKLLGGVNKAQQVTRGQAAQLVYQAQQLVAEQSVRVTSLRALNPITLEVVFSKPLAAQDVDLEQAKQDFAFDNGLKILNIPQLKTGSTQTYIVPVTVQKPGVTYALAYKGKKAGAFLANEQKLTLKSTQQVAFDTFEVESRLEDGITDYSNIVMGYYGKRGGLEFALDENNSYNGKTYQVVSSMRDKQVYITPAGGETMVATYVPYTQNTDRRQAPKFRLPNGATFKPGVTYTVTSDWATIASPTFTAKQIAPLAIKTVSQASPTSVDVTLAADPADELFGSRSITLTAADGSKLTAQYRVMTRKGATGTFDMQNGGKLTPGTTYTVQAAGAWATAEDVQLTAK